MEILAFQIWILQYIYKFIRNMENYRGNNYISCKNISCSFLFMFVLSKNKYSNLVVQIGYIIKKSHKKILRFFFGSGHVIAAAAVVAPVVAPILAPVAAAAPLIAASAPLLATASAALSEADRFGRNRYWSEDNEEDSNYERDREIAENQAETERLWRAIEDLKKKSKNTMQQRAKSPRRGTSPGPKKRNTRNC
jgi:hypothetical protein